MSQRADAFSTASAAFERHDWRGAFALLSETDAARGLDPEGLRLLGKAGWWMSDRRACVDAWERAFGGFIAVDNRRRAANVAYMLGRSFVNNYRDATEANAWYKRMERLLAGLPESPEHGYLQARNGGVAWRGGDADAGRRSIEDAVEIGTRQGDQNLVAMASAWLGVHLASAGRHEEGWGYIDEACTAAVGGQLGPFATGIVYCNAISAYRDVGEFGQAGHWTEAASRWCARNSITAFPGICRVHRAEVMRIRGNWQEAEREAREAWDEMRDFTPAFAGDAMYEVGEVRLRLGDLDGAEEAFAMAHQLGHEPQPGAALLQLELRDAKSALASIMTAELSRPDIPPVDKARILAAQVEMALAAGRSDVAEESLGALTGLAAGTGTAAIAALERGAAGLYQLHISDPEALATLRDAARKWQEVGATYELASTRLALARAYSQAGDATGARRELRSAHAAFAELGAASDMARADKALTELATSETTPVAVTQCFMFTDIVDSTKLVDAIGDESWTNLIEWHDETLRACFAHHDGRELDHAGDGFFVTFADAVPAFECATRIQRSLAEHRRRHGFAPRVRIGLHAATATQQAGRFRGKGVHEAARVGALAGAEEIVASAISVPPGFRVSNARSVVVKGFIEPIDVVSVDWREGANTT